MAFYAQSTSNLRAIVLEARSIYIIYPRLGRCVCNQVLTAHPSVSGTDTACGHWASRGQLGVNDISVTSARERKKFLEGRCVEVSVLRPRGVEASVLRPRAVEVPCTKHLEVLKNTCAPIS